MQRRAAERLYHLLPQIYRQRDAEQGQPLRALLAVIESEFLRLEMDIDAAYDDWFVETCNSWVIPYLADLVGITDLVDVKFPHAGQRRRIANHVAYQRRKGQLSVLAHVARDVTGWPAFAVESARLVAQTLAPGADRASASRTFDVRGAALANTPFDRSARTLDVRGVHGRKNRSINGLAGLRAIALYLWRLRSYPLHRAQAGVQERIRRGRQTRHFSFDPLGRDRPLFIHAQAITDLQEPFRPIHFPQPLTRTLLAADLAQANHESTSELVGPSRSLAIWLDDVYVRPEEMFCGELNGRNTAAWRALLESQNKAVVIDPENGRLLFDSRHPHSNVAVRYAYGRLGDIGSNPTSRRLNDSPHLIQITRDAATYGDDNVVDSLAAALARWHEICAAAGNEAPPQGSIRFLDSAIYNEPRLTVPLPGGGRLTLEAASGECPVIITEGITVEHYAALGLAGEVREVELFTQVLALSGIFLEGPLDVAGVGSSALTVTLSHCTLTKTLTIKAGTPGQKIEILISESIASAVDLQGRNGHLHLRDSIVDPGPDHEGLALQTGAGARATIERTTILGDVKVAHLGLFADSLVLGTVRAAAHDDNDFAAQYSYFRATDLPPVACHHCVSGDDERPLFTSRDPIHPGYAQLANACPRSIREGGRNGSEMGVSNKLDSSRRRQSLRDIHDEYFPLGHALGIFHAT